MIRSLNVSTSSAERAVWAPDPSPASPAAGVGVAITGPGFTIGAIGLIGWIGTIGPGLIGCTTIGGCIGGRTGPVTIGVVMIGVTGGAIGGAGDVIMGAVIIGPVIGGRMGPRQVTLATITALCASTRPDPVAISTPAVAV